MSSFYSTGSDVRTYFAHVQGGRKYRQGTFSGRYGPANHADYDIDFDHAGTVISDWQLYRASTPGTDVADGTNVTVIADATPTGGATSRKIFLSILQGATIANGDDYVLRAVFDSVHANSTTTDVSGEQDIADRSITLATGITLSTALSMTQNWTALHDHASEGEVITLYPSNDAKALGDVGTDNGAGYWTLGSFDLSGGLAPYTFELYDIDSDGLSEVLTTANPTGNTFEIRVVDSAANVAAATRSYSTSVEIIPRDANGLTMAPVTFTFRILDNPTVAIAANSSSTYYVNDAVNAIAGSGATGADDTYDGSTAVLDSVVSAETLNSGSAVANLTVDEISGIAATDAFWALTNTSNDVLVGAGSATSANIFQINDGNAIAGDTSVYFVSSVAASNANVYAVNTIGGGSEIKYTEYGRDFSPSAADIFCVVFSAPALGTVTTDLTSSAPIYVGATGSDLNVISDVNLGSTAWRNQYVTGNTPTVSGTGYTNSNATDIAQGTYTSGSAFGSATVSINTTNLPPLRRIYSHDDISVQDFTVHSSIMLRSGDVRQTVTTAQYRLWYIPIPTFDIDTTTSVYKIRAGDDAGSPAVLFTDRTDATNGKILTVSVSNGLSGATTIDTSGEGGFAIVEVNSGGSGDEFQMNSTGSQSTFGEVDLFFKTATSANDSTAYAPRTGGGVNKLKYTEYGTDYDVGSLPTAAALFAAPATGGFTASLSATAPLYNKSGFSTTVATGLEIDSGGFDNGSGSVSDVTVDESSNSDVTNAGALTTISTTSALIDTGNVSSGRQTYANAPTATLRVTTNILLQNGSESDGVTYVDNTAKVWYLTVPHFDVTPNPNSQLNAGTNEWGLSQTGSWATFALLRVALTNTYLDGSNPAAFTLTDTATYDLDNEQQSGNNHTIDVSFDETASASEYFFMSANGTAVTSQKMYYTEFGEDHVIQDSSNNDLLIETSSGSHANEAGETLKFDLSGGDATVTVTAATTNSVYEAASGNSKADTHSVVINISGNAFSNGFKVLRETSSGNDNFLHDVTANFDFYSFDGVSTETLIQSGTTVEEAWASATKSDAVRAYLNDSATFSTSTTPSNGEIPYNRLTTGSGGLFGYRFIGVQGNATETVGDHPSSSDHIDLRFRQRPTFTISAVDDVATNSDLVSIDRYTESGTSYRAFRTTGNTERLRILQFVLGNGLASSQTGFQISTNPGSYYELVTSGGSAPATTDTTVLAAFTSSVAASKDGFSLPTITYTERTGDGVNNKIFVLDLDEDGAFSDNSVSSSTVYKYRVMAISNFGPDVDVGSVNASVSEQGSVYHLDHTQYNDNGIQMQVTHQYGIGSNGTYTLLPAFTNGAGSPNAQSQTLGGADSSTDEGNAGILSQTGSNYAVSEPSAGTTGYDILATGYSLGITTGRLTTQADTGTALSGAALFSGTSTNGQSTYVWYPLTAVPSAAATLHLPNNITDESVVIPPASLFRGGVLPSSSDGDTDYTEMGTTGSDFQGSLAGTYLQLAGGNASTAHEIQVTGLSAGTVAIQSETDVVIALSDHRGTSVDIYSTAGAANDLTVNVFEPPTLSAATANGGHLLYMDALDAAIVSGTTTTPNAITITDITFDYTGGHTDYTGVGGSNLPNLDGDVNKLLADGTTTSVVTDGSDPTVDGEFIQEDNTLTFAVNGSAPDWTVTEGDLVIPANSTISNFSGHTFQISHTMPALAGSGVWFLPLGVDTTPKSSGNVIESTSVSHYLVFQKLQADPHSFWSSTVTDETGAASGSGPTYYSKTLTNYFDTDEVRAHETGTAQSKADDI